MGAFFGDLIVPDVDPLEASARLPACEAQKALEALRDIAEEVGVKTVWQSVVLVGTDGSSEPPGPARGVLGISLAWACVAGIGYWRDYHLQREPPAQATPAGASGGLADLLRNRAAGEASIRGPEVDALRRIVAAAGGAVPFPLKVLENIEGTLAYSFEVAYRRRLAYALAFEASIATASLEPYIVFMPSLAGASASDFITRLPTAEAPEAFSVFLNIMSLLDRMVAAESAQPTAHGIPAVQVIDAEAKRAQLASRLDAAAAQRCGCLTEDGRIALRALFVELALQRSWRITPLDPLPRWGTLATSEAYVR